MKIFSTILLLFFCLSANGQSVNCEAKEYRAFDFWIGNWEVYNKFTGVKIGDNLVKRILDQCVIKENWSSLEFNEGTSLNYYNSHNKKWKQKWVDNEGNSLEFTGTIQNDTARFTASSIHPKSLIKTQHRMMIAKVKFSELHQVKEQSVDGGPWNVVFNARYLRNHKPLRDKAKHSIYKYLKEAHQDFNYELMEDLFTKDAWLAVPDKKLIKGNRQIKKYFKSYFDELKKRGVSKGHFTVDRMNRNEFDNICVDIGYYYQFYEDDQGREILDAGKFHATLIKEGDGYFRFHTFSIDQEKNKKMKNDIFQGKF